MGNYDLTRIYADDISILPNICNFIATKLDVSIPPEARIYGNYLEFWNPSKQYTDCIISDVIRAFPENKLTTYWSGEWSSFKEIIYIESYDGKRVYHDEYDLSKLNIKDVNDCIFTDEMLNIIHVLRNNLVNSIDDLPENLEISMKLRYS